MGTTSIYLDREASFDRGVILIGILVAMMLIPLIGALCWRSAARHDAKGAAHAILTVLDGARIRAGLEHQTTGILCIPRSGTLAWSRPPVLLNHTAYSAPPGTVVLACRFGTVGSQHPTAADGDNTPAPGARAGTEILFYPDGSTTAGEITIIGRKSSCVITQSVLGAHRQECRNVR